MPRKPPPKKRAGQQRGPRRVNGALWDVREGAQQLGLTEKALRAQIARGLIPYRRHGGRLVLIADEVRAFFRRLPGVNDEAALVNVANRNGAP